MKTKQIRLKSGLNVPKNHRLITFTLLELLSLIYDEGCNTTSLHYDLAAITVYKQQVLMCTQSNHYM